MGGAGTAVVVVAEALLMTTLPLPAANAVTCDGKEDTSENPLGDEKTKLGGGGGGGGAFSPPPCRFHVRDIYS